MRVITVLTFDRREQDDFRQLLFVGFLLISHLINWEYSFSSVRNHKLKQIQTYSLFLCLNEQEKTSSDCFLICFLTMCSQTFLQLSHTTVLPGFIITYQQNRTLTIWCHQSGCLKAMTAYLSVFCLLQSGLSLVVRVQCWRHLNMMFQLEELTDWKQTNSSTRWYKPLHVHIWVMLIIMAARNWMHLVIVLLLVLMNPEISINVVISDRRHGKWESCTFLLFASSSTKAAAWRVSWFLLHVIVRPTMSLLHTHTLKQYDVQLILQSLAAQRKNCEHTVTVSAAGGRWSSEVNLEALTNTLGDHFTVFSS